MDAKPQGSAALWTEGFMMKTTAKLDITVDVAAIVKWLVILVGMLVT